MSEKIVYPVMPRQTRSAYRLLMVGRKIIWRLLKSHAGHPENDRVDGLTNAEAQKAAMAVGFAGRARQQLDHHLTVPSRKLTPQLRGFADLWVWQGILLDSLTSSLFSFD